MAYELYGNLKGLSKHNYLALTTQLQNEEINGFMVVDTVLEDVDSFQLLYFQRQLVKDGPLGWKLAKSDSISTMYSRAISVGKSSAGELCPMLIYGGIRNDNWAFNDGTDIFVDDNISGGLTTTPPSTKNHIIQSVGIIEDKNQVFFTFPPVWLWNIEEYT